MNLYEKKYKEALCWMQSVYPTMTGTVKEDAEHFFPELKEKENEDERIRESLLEYLHTLPNHYTHGGVCVLEWIAWLEKQKVITIQEDLQGKEDVLWCIKQAQKYAKDENEMGTCWFAENWLKKQGEKGAKGNDGGIPFSEQEPYEGLTDFERTLADICIGWIGQELGWKQYIKDNADVLLKIAVKKFNSIQDAPFEQKPAEWDKDDITRINEIIETLNIVQENRVRTQRMHYSKATIDKNIDWLKSLKDKYTWKPTEEQIMVLAKASETYCDRDKNTLYSLYNDLKKLREE